MQMRGVDFGMGASHTDADVNKSNTRDALT